MSSLQISVDTAGLSRMSDMLASAGKRAPIAAKRAVRHTGGVATTAIRRALPGQTGLKRRVIDKAVKGSMAGPAYEIRSHGGNVRLKYFGARETRPGVSAAPWNSRRVYAGTFMKGGRFPNRVPAARLNGHVYKRTGAGRLPITLQRSGLFIPTEMITGASASAFYTTVEQRLPTRLAHELGWAMGGG